jgi:zinc protease
MKTSKYLLKNGLQVLLCESHKAPVISVQMWVRTGSADEGKGEEGISHFIEHLVFKGTAKYKVGEIAATIEGSGGELNAYTSFDQTVFHVTLSSHFADVGLDVIAEMMGFPEFDAQEIDNEREVVIEEIKRGKDSLGRAASQALFSNVYRRHAYGVPVIGFEKNIRKLKPQKIKEFYHSRYAPKNMFLVVSGDFDMLEMKKKVAAHYGRFQDYKIKKVKRKPEPAQKTPRVWVEKANFEQSLAYLSFRIPAVNHKDIPALDVLSMILGQGDSSRLVQKLRIEEALVNSIGASAYAPLDPGLFMVSFGYNKEKLETVLGKISETLFEFLQDGVKPGELERSFMALQTDEYYSTETVDGLSRRLGSMEFYFKDLKSQDKYLKAVRALKPEDILKIAKKYLVSNTFSVSVVSNDEESRLKKIVASWVKDFKVREKKLKDHKAIKPKTFKIHHPKMPSAFVVGKAKKEHGTEKRVLENGVTVLLRPSRDAQLITAKVAMLGGLRLEPDATPGLNECLGRTLTTGTENRTEKQISEETEKIAAGLGPVAGRNSVGLGLDVLTPFEKQGADLFFDVLHNPTFPEDCVEREKFVQIEQIKNRADNPGQACGRRFLEAIFAGHVYAKDPMGSEDGLAKTHSNDLKQIWKRHLEGKNMTFSLAGNFDEDFWLEKIEKLSQSVPTGARHLQNMPLSDVREDIHLFEASKKEQSHLILGYRALNLSSPERYTLQIIQSILAGQGGRLFIELRDKNSLAYSVSPMQFSGVETGYFGAYIGCSPEKADTALKMMKVELRKLMETAVPDHELERSKKYLMGRHDIDLQRVSAINSAILYNDIYGLDYNEPFNCYEKYEAVTAKDILQLSQRLFSQKEVVSLVGPKNIF